MTNIFSQPRPQQPQAQQQCAGAVERSSREPGGGAVAQVRVTAVDAHPGQLLLLAVSGCGTAAGQDDAQGRCEEQRRQTDKQSVKSVKSVNQSNRQLVKGRVTSCCVPQQAEENAQVSSRECKCVIRETFSDLRDKLIRTCLFSPAPLTTLQPSN